MYTVIQTKDGKFAARLSSTKAYIFEYRFDALIYAQTQNRKLEKLAQAEKALETKPKSETGDDVIDELLNRIKEAKKIIVRDNKGRYTIGADLSQKA